MIFKEITDKGAWNSFVLSLKPNTFLHSYEWGQVQRADGETVRYIGMFEGETQIGAAVLITVNARRGRFLFCPHGPLFTTEEETVKRLPEFVEYAKELAKKEGCVAVRISPLVIESSAAREAFGSLGFRDAPMHVHTERTWVLDISSSEDDLLKGMRKTTRHAIRKAEREGVVTSISTDPKDVERFLPLYHDTTVRHQFTPFSKTFLTTQATQFAQDNRMYFIFAKYEGKDVAGAMIIQFGDTVFYHHGASIKLPSSVPAAQYLQWQSIREAKKRGARLYNFWGIAPENEPNHPFAGITVFKQCFGGYALDYMHAQDLPLGLGYWKLWAIEIYRKYKRGF